MLQPVQEHFWKRNVKDTFAFVDMLQDNPTPSDTHMCSFDVVSLFTNVPVMETIDICAQALYHNNDIDDTSTPWLTEEAFPSLMTQVTLGVEFSFTDIMYKQVDGVAMGSPLGPVLANIFVGYCESRIEACMWPDLYIRFVDDSCTYFDNKEQSEVFMELLNNLHPALRFTTYLRARAVWQTGFFGCASREDGYLYPHLGLPQANLHRTGYSLLGPTY